jgi:hypothetical protein
MNARPDLAALLPPVEAVDALPPELLPGLVAGLAALQARAAARLAVPAVPAAANGAAEPDVLLDDVREVARIIGHSVSWVRRHGHTLPGFRQRGKGCKVSWSRRGIEAWVRSPNA